MGRFTIYYMSHKKMTLDGLEALVALTHVPGLGAVRVKQLIEHFGSAEVALDADAGAIAQIPGFGPKITAGWEKHKSADGWKRDRDLAAERGVRLLPYTDPEYPKALLEVPDHPVLLYVAGEILPEDSRSLAVVGTRNATIYGMEMAAQISRTLARSGFTIVSGLARGIDTAAHQATLDAGRTIAVIGSGLANIYPKENNMLAKAIAEDGALISEYPMMTPPSRQSFPQRNRIVAGMTLGTVLIEAPFKSGAMITMANARDYGKKLFALPGRADTEAFRGNHQLIKRGEAQLIEGARDILESFSVLPALESTPQPELNEEEQQLMTLLPSEELSIEEITLKTQLPVPKLNVLLMRLVLKKLVKKFPGRIYKKVSIS